MMARLFALTVLVYPLALALLCVGAGLLVDRASGAFLPAALLPSVGAAALIGVSQLSTCFSVLARATPYLLLAAAVAGFALGGARIRMLLGALARHGARERDGARAGRRCALALAPLAYALAIAPVLLGGRASFSSFMALSDSAVHMIGADYLLRHGQQYAHLDLRNSYGRFIENYYGTGYPSGADTLYGGSSLLLGLPLIWTFQPFVASMLALASGPAWELARRVGVRGASAALAALAVTVPALVYGYELVGSVKEIVSLAMLLTLGALVVGHRRWLARGARRAIPFALVLAAGVSALGVGFGAWGLAAVLVLLLALIGGLRAGWIEPRAALATVATGALALLVAAWPTWRHVSASLHVAQAIASTSNAGNLQTPLRWTQAFGVWLRGSYKEPPVGVWSDVTHALVAVAIAACALGGAQLLRTRRFALAGWVAATLVVWIALADSATTWVDAKALVLSSPVVVLLAWGGVAALRGRPRDAPAGGRARRPARGALASRLAAALLALALIGGVVGSDAAQYHDSSLAPTARYEELASINRRFAPLAHGGPALFTDFDEYSMYVLRDLDVGGPDFVYPPPALASLAGGYGRPVALQRASPQQLASYPLIVTRRDPSAPQPPPSYALAWEGTYYEVWSRAGAGRPALARGRRLQRRARLVRVPLVGAGHPVGWGRERGGWAMRRAGTLTVRFALPRAGSWTLWLQGQFMPRVTVALDGARVASIAGQLAGNSLVPDAAPPIPLRLAAGAHALSVTRAGFSLAPGNGGPAVLAAAFLTPGATAPGGAGGSIGG
jgi:hypothetical protein